MPLRSTIVGTGIAVAIAVGFFGLGRPIGTAIATPIPMPTPKVVAFLSVFKAAGCGSSATVRSLDLDDHPGGARVAVAVAGPYSDQVLPGGEIRSRELKLLGGGIGDPVLGEYQEPFPAIDGKLSAGDPACSRNGAKREARLTNS